MNIRTSPCIECGRRYKRLTKNQECYYCNPKKHREEYFVTKIK